MLSSLPVLIGCAARPVDLGFEEQVAIYRAFARTLPACGSKLEAVAIGDLMSTDLSSREGVLVLGELHPDPEPCTAMDCSTKCCNGCGAIWLLRPPGSSERPAHEIRERPGRPSKRSRALLVDLKSWVKPMSRLRR